MGYLFFKKIIFGITILSLFIKFSTATSLNEENYLSINQTYNGFIVELLQNQSERSFNTEQFIEEFNVGIKPKSARGPLVEIDLSKCNLVTSKDINDILSSIIQKNLRIKVFNLEKTFVEQDIINIFSVILSKTYFRMLNITCTPAAQDWDTLSLILKDSKVNKYISKIIFLEEKELNLASANQIFGSKVINRHLDYYQTTKTILKAWREVSFEGKSMERVQHLLSGASRADNKFFGPKMQKSFVNTTTLRNIQTLNFDFIHLENSFIENLFKNPIFRQIKNLSFKESTIGNQGVIYIAQAPLENLEYLNLYYNDLDNTALAELKNNNFPNLKELILSANYNINDEDINMLSDNLPNLTSLSLDFIENITSKCVPYLKNFTSIQILNLFGCNLENEGAISISQSKFLYLKKLDLGRNNIGDEGAIHFSDTTNMPRLYTLDLKDNPLIQRETKKLLKSNDSLRNIYF